MSFRIGAMLGFLWALSACGGGGSGTEPNTIVLSTCSKELMRVQSGELIRTGESDGPGGGAGDSGSDGSGSLGQFRNTVVVVKNKDLDEIGRAVTDPTRGMINIRLGGCKEPIEVEYRGGQGATYFDEATGKSEPFPEGYRLRARFPELPKHFGVTPYTEAAVRLHETESVGATSLDAVAIARANNRIAEILTDQVPAHLRTPGTDGFGLIDITQQPVVLNESNALTRGTLTDSASGRYGAIIAGFGLASGTFVGGQGTGGSLSLPVGGSSGKATTEPLGPALRAMLQLVEDLADGNLDLQGPKGLPVLQAGEPSAYSYETLWRAKTIAAGITSKAAGAIELIGSSERAKVAEYVFSVASVYRTERCLGDGCELYEARSTGGQTVRLYADGRLSLQRGMSAAFGQDRRYFSAQTTPREKDVVVRDPMTGEVLRFVDVKVGSRGEIIALQQDRRALVYIDPLSLYTVRGDEIPDDPGNVARLEAKLAVSLRHIELGNGAASRVVSFTPSPAERTLVESRVPPDFLYVMSDGALWGGYRDARIANFPLPQPDSLQSVVYDKFVPPSYDSRYGRSPTFASQLPWTGPRRLYGLTRRGEVLTWLEGEKSTGVRLDIPTNVILLAAESKTAVYALTGDGKVFWINADQSHVATSDAAVEQRPSLSDFRRGFPLHHVEPVPLEAPVCWLARTEAVACKTGDLFRWKEGAARFTYGASNVDSTFVPISAAIVPVKEAGISPIWRLSAVEEFYSQRFGSPSVFIEGIRYITVKGAATSLEEERKERNILSTLHQFPTGEFQYVTGKQLRTALQSLFNTHVAPLTNGLLKRSSSPAGHLLEYRISTVSPGFFSVSMNVAGPVPEHPNVDFTLGFQSTGSSIEGLRVATLHAGDPRTTAHNSNNRATDIPNKAPVRFDDSDFIRMDNTYGAWELIYLTPISIQPGGSILQLKLLPMAILSRPYAFRLCFNVEGQSVRETSVRFSRLGCTVHDNSGAYLGSGSGMSTFSRFVNGNREPAGNATRIDFGHLYESD